MTTKNPQTKLDTRFSSEGATAISWREGSRLLEEAEVYWISTVRPDGRPHVTPMIALWLDESLYFTTGETERKARNLETNQHVAVTTGCNALGEGLDIVIEGEAVRVTDETQLQRIADAYLEKYEEWHFEVRDGALWIEGGGTALAFEVSPVKAFGFGKGDPYYQTRWRF